MSVFVCVCASHFLSFSVCVGFVMCILFGVCLKALLK